jgi:hypothetical protein
MKQARFPGLPGKTIRSRPERGDFARVPEAAFPGVNFRFNLTEVILLKKGVARETSPGTLAQPDFRQARMAGFNCSCFKRNY